jgi:hypothetical protein
MQIPQIDSIEELARFWDTHDLTDFEGQLEEVVEPVFERETVVRVRPAPGAARAASLAGSIPRASEIREGGLMATRDESSADPDPLIEALKADVDRTLLRQNLKLTVEQRLRQLHEFQKAAMELRAAGRGVRSWQTQK